MNVDLDHLESAAKAATPGPWVTDPRNCDIVIRYADAGDVAEAQRISNAGNDAYYIAAVSPDVVLELIAELRKARAEREWIAQRIVYRHDACAYPCKCGGCPPCYAECVECWLNAAREAVEEQKP